MILNALNFRQWGQRMERALSDQTLETHLLGALLAADLMKGMISAGFWILSDGTMIARVARLSSYPGILALLWIVLACAVLPYFGMQVFGVWPERRRPITRLACRAILAAGVLWAYLAYLSKNIDSLNVTGVFILHSITCVLMSALLASSINTAQGREAQRQGEPQ
jgi:hypothetical protein